MSLRAKRSNLRETRFFTSSRGELVTNYHVIEGADSLLVKLLTGALFPVSGWLASDQEKDFAVLKVQGKELPIKKFLEANPEWRKDRIDRKYYTGYYLNDWYGMDYPNGKADHPVVRVGWYAAAAYAQWVGAKLPTEAQWERAARGGLVGKRYPWGDTITHDSANYSGTAGRDRWDGTSPVKSFPANGYGLFDMAGNVWEWCADEYNSGYYSRSPQNNPTGPGTPILFVSNDFTNVTSSRVLRGGSWYFNVLRDLRCADRINDGPTEAADLYGFRCCSR